MWTYTISQGELLDPTGKLVAHGYSGLGLAKNDPAAQMLHDQGPLPVGKYIIGTPFDSPKTGPYTLALLPDPANEMYGRDDFRIHGDSKEHPGAASDGCIILARPAREEIWNSGDHLLDVVSGVDTPSDLDVGEL